MRTYYPTVAEVKKQLAARNALIDKLKREIDEHRAVESQLLKLLEDATLMEMRGEPTGVYKEE
jgi:predicted component of type VI protein secretion system